MALLSPTKFIRSSIALFKQHAISYAISLGIIALMLLHASHVMPLAFINKLENYSYDLRLNLLMPRTIDNRIVIVDIDEKSLVEQGRWPWSRDKLAQLMNTLFDNYHINTLGFDVVFAEKDESSGLKNIQWMQQQYLKDNAAFADAFNKVKPKLNYDQLFADSIKNRKVVLGYYFQTSGDTNHIGQLPAETFSVDSFDGQNIGAIQASGYGANLAILQNSAPTAGHFNPEPDDDGITRKISVFIDYQQKYYESLAFAVARTYLNAPVQVKFASLGVSESSTGLESFTLGNKRIPVDAQIAALIPFRGAQGSFQYVSASDVLNNKVRLESLNNKIVLVGTTAPGLMDLRSAPVQSNYPGVEMHANMISGILDNNIKQQPAFVNGIEFLLLLLAGLLLMYSLPRLNPLKSSLLSLAVLAAIFGINIVGWQYANLVLPIAASLLMVSLIYLVNMSVGFF